MRRIVACLLVVVLLASCTGPTAAPTPTPVPTDTPVPTATPDLAATAEAAAASATAAAAIQQTAIAEGIKNAMATAAQETAVASATAAAQAKQTSAAATATMRASWTDTPEPTPTSTPRPTNTPGPSPTPRPTNTPTRPPSSIAIAYTDMRYETWGRPVGGCSQFNNDDPVRKFNVNVTITNNGTAATGFWGVDAYDSNGTPLITCFYFYGDWRAAPGESKSVTWAAFTNNDTYVRRFVTSIYDEELTNIVETFVQCFGPNGELTGC